MLLAAGANQSSPWWGTPVIAGSFLVLGAVLSFLFGRFSDRTQARRDREEFIRLESRKSGIAFLEAVSGVFTQKIARRDEGILLKADISAMVTAWGVLSVSADPAVIRAGWNYREALTNLPYSTDESHPVLIDTEIDAKIEAYREAREQFINGSLTHFPGHLF